MSKQADVNKTYPSRQHSCYDCGSTIPGHHTKSCDLAPAGSIKDLPQIDGTQYWVATFEGGDWRHGRLIPDAERPGRCNSVSSHQGDQT